MPRAVEEQESETNHAKLATIIRMRLELEEEWRTSEDFVLISGRIQGRESFESAFRKLVERGCRWDVLLACVNGFLRYNLDQISQPPKTTSDQTRGPAVCLGLSPEELFLRFGDDDLQELAKPRLVLKPKPPTAYERARMRTNLDAVINDLRQYDTLLFELGPPTVEWIGAMNELPRWLKRVASLLTETSMGNARAIQSAGLIVPCIYTDVIASRQKASLQPPRPLVLLKHLADLLNECNRGEPVYSGAQLSEALRRFKREFPDIHKNICSKVCTLHDGPPATSEKWGVVYLRDVYGTNR
jgi:hypothetical protein